MTLNLVSEQLLTANNINQQDLFFLLGQLSERRLDYADLYFQSSFHESWVLEDKIIKDGSYHIDQGVGVRAVSGEKTGFAYADQITMNALRLSSEAARSIVREQGMARRTRCQPSSTARSMRLSIRLAASAVKTKSPCYIVLTRLRGLLTHGFRK